MTGLDGAAVEADSGKNVSVASDFRQRNFTQQFLFHPACVRKQEKRPDFPVTDKVSREMIEPHAFFSYSIMTSCYP